MPRYAWPLLALVISAGVAAYLLWPRPEPPPPAQPTLCWVFEATERGALIAAPCVSPEAIYVAAIHDRGFRSIGAVYALDPATGKPQWRFDGDGRMLGSASAPTLAGDRLFVGEGMHASHACHLYCLDPKTGKQLWAFDTTDHVEASATVHDGTVYFGSGNDGVYAVDVETGKQRWQFNEGLHVDSAPCVMNGKVIVGSGPSRRFQTLAVVAIDAKLGREVWRRPTDIPAWGAPRAANGRVYVGLANGRLNEAAQHPAGALLCLDERDGRELWRVPAGDAVFQQPTLDGDRVYFGSRDGHLYAVRADSGDALYKVPVGGPVIAAPAVDAGAVYVATTGGVLKAFDAADGRERWAYDLRRGHPVEPIVYGAVRAAGGRVYVAAEIKTGAGSVATLYCVQP